MSDRALIVGINAYPGDDALRGCVNDALEWQRLMRASAMSTTTFLDGDATASAIRHGLEKLVGGAQAGDRLAFVFSGHGAQMVDGDSSTDTICPVDFDWTAERALDVGDFAALFGQIPRDCSAVAIFDCCNSGGIGGDASKAIGRRVRTMARPGLVNFGAPEGSLSPTVGPDGRAAMPAASRRTFTGALPYVAVLAACDSKGTAADAVIGGKPCGAFTHHLLDALRSPTLGTLAVDDLVRAVSATLHASGYDQAPQASGPAEILNAPFLAAMCV